MASESTFASFAAAGEGDPGRAPRGHGHAAEHRRRRRHRAQSPRQPADDPQPEVPGMSGPLRPPKTKPPKKILLSDKLVFRCRIAIFYFLFFLFSLLFSKCVSNE